MLHKFLNETAVDIAQKTISAFKSRLLISFCNSCRAKCIACQFGIPDKYGFIRRCKTQLIKITTRALLSSFNWMENLISTPSCVQQQKQTSNCDSFWNSWLFLKYQTTISDAEIVFHLPPWFHSSHPVWRLGKERRGCFLNIFFTMHWDRHYNHHYAEKEIWSWWW